MALGALKDTIQNLAAAPTGHFVMFTGLLTVACVFTGYRAFRALRWRRLVQDMPTSRTRSAPQGYIELAGAAKMMDGPPIKTPMSQTPCVWWQLLVEENKDGSWSRVSRERSDELFVIEDDVGRCIVDPEGAEVTPSHRRVSRGGSGKPSLRTAGARFRYTESFIECEEVLYVIGWHRTFDSVAGWDPDAELVEKLREWKRDQPTLMRRFDVNDDGRIDDEEWALARREARREVLDEHRDASVRPGVNVIGAPDDARPFLIAAQHEDLVSIGLRRSTIGHAVGCLITGLIALSLIQARFAMFF